MWLTAFCLVCEVLSVCWWFPCVNDIQCVCYKEGLVQFLHYFGLVS